MKEAVLEVTSMAEEAFLIAIYARLSIEDTRDREGGSLEDQIALEKNS